MIDVYFYEMFSEEESEIKAILPNSVIAGFSRQTIQESGHQNPPSRLISIRTQSVVPETWSDNLDGIFSRSQGFDHLERLRRKGFEKVAMGYLPSYCSNAVAEHALISALTLLRNFPLQQKQFRSFNREGLTGTESAGLFALVVGVGNIGREIVRLTRGVGMIPRGVDPCRRESDVEYVSLTEGLLSSRVIFCAVPLTETTRGMLDYQALKQGEPGKILVNISRGDITPVEDMARLLTENYLAGLAMDVFPFEERLATALRSADTDDDAHCLRELSRRTDVVFTPHNAFNTIQALRRKAQGSVDAVLRFLDSRQFPLSLPDTRKGD